MQEEPLTLITPPIFKAISAAQAKELTQPLLLFLAGHRPIAFAVGQVLILGSPIGAMFGWHAIADWADLFSHPNGPSQLEQLLRQQHAGDTISRAASSQ